MYHGTWQPASNQSEHQHQLSNQSTITINTITHNELLCNWQPDQQARSPKASPSLCLQLTRLQKQQSRECSILNCAPQPSQTEGRGDSGFLYRTVRPSLKCCADKLLLLLLLLAAMTYNQVQSFRSITVRIIMWTLKLLVYSENIAGRGKSRFAFFKTINIDVIIRTKQNKIMTTAWSHATT